jgi:hypothetical protein
MVMSGSSRIRKATKYIRTALTRYRVSLGPTCVKSQLLIDLEPPTHGSCRNHCEASAYCVYSACANIGSLEYLPKFNTVTMIAIVVSN